MKVDAAHCLSTDARTRCVVLDEREEMMRVATINGERGPWGEDFDPRPSCAGRSLVQRMEDALDEVVLAINVHWARGIRGSVEFDLHTQLLNGRANGIAECIALVRTPYHPDIEAVKAAANARYQARLSGVTA